MIVGNPSVFAIESEVIQFYERRGFLGLGFFLIHILNRCYGVREPDATMLACSFDEVERRMAARGRHTAPFAVEKDAGKIADAFRDAVYAPDQSAGIFLGIPQEVFVSHIYSNHLVWAPDGDEAFDDGSYVLQFDVNETVRLIGYGLTGLKGDEERYHHDPSTLNDLTLDADVFYNTLKAWRDQFHAEWEAAPKTDEE